MRVGVRCLVNEHRLEPEDGAVGEQGDDTPVGETAARRKFFDAISVCSGRAAGTSARTSN